MADSSVLNDHHNEMVASYLRFAKFQRSRHLRSVEQSFENIKMSRILDETFTADEVTDMMNELCQLLKGDSELELISVAHMAALLLCQLCSQAQQWHLKLQADISELENRDMLEKVNKIEEKLSSNHLEKNVLGSPLRFNKLEPLSESSGSNKLLNMEIERLREENKKITERLKDVESQVIETLQKKTALSEELMNTQQVLKEWKERKAENVDQDLKFLENEVSKVKQDLETSMCESAVTQQNLECDLFETKERLLEVQSQLELAEKELELKFSETAAYKNMKQILAAKNEQIRALRNELSQFEPKEEN